MFIWIKLNINLVGISELIYSFMCNPSGPRYKYNLAAQTCYIISPYSLPLVYYLYGQNMVVIELVFEIISLQRAALFLLLIATVLHNVYILPMIQSIDMNYHTIK